MQKYLHLRLTYIYTITAPDTRLYGLTLWLCRVLSSADNQRLTLTGCGLQRQQACCRVTVTLHQKRNVNPLHQTKRHFDRVSEKAK